MNPSISRMATLFLIFLFGSTLLVASTAMRGSAISPVVHYAFAE